MRQRQFGLGVEVDLENHSEEFDWRLGWGVREGLVVATSFEKLTTRVVSVATPLNKSSEVNSSAVPLYLAPSTVQSQPEPHRCYWLIYTSLPSPSSEIGYISQAPVSAVRSSFVAVGLIGTEDLCSPASAVVHQGNRRYRFEDHFEVNSRDYHPLRPGVDVDYLKELEMFELNGLEIRDLGGCEGMLGLAPRSSSEAFSPEVVENSL